LSLRQITARHISNWPMTLGQILNFKKRFCIIKNACFIAEPCPHALQFRALIAGNRRYRAGYSPLSSSA
jgi:hypothetical protein